MQTDPCKIARTTEDCLVMLTDRSPCGSDFRYQAIYETEKWTKYSTDSSPRGSDFRYRAIYEIEKWAKDFVNPLGRIGTNESQMYAPFLQSYDFYDMDNHTHKLTFFMFDPDYRRIEIVFCLSIDDWAAIFSISDKLDCPCKKLFAKIVLKTVTKAIDEISEWMN